MGSQEETLARTDLDPLHLTPRRQTDEQLELGNFGLLEAEPGSGSD